MYGYKIKGGKQGLFNRKDARVRANTKRNAKEDWEESVSYTHLDVYKRQRLGKCPVLR